MLYEMLHSFGHRVVSCCILLYLVWSEKIWVPTFSNKLKLNRPILIVVNDYDLKGRLIDWKSAGKIDSVQNTWIKFRTNLDADWLFILTEAGEWFDAREYLTKFAGKIDSVQNTWIKFRTNLEADWLFILTEAGEWFGAREHLTKFAGKIDSVQNTWIKFRTNLEAD